MIRPSTKKSSTDRPVIYNERWKGSYGSLGYRSARIASSENRNYISYPGSAHDDRDRKKLIAQSRDFKRNNAIYDGMIEQAVLRIVGDGFKLQVNATNKAVARKIEKLWRDWFRRPEIRGLLSGAKTSRMVMREILVAGDTICLKTDKGTLQLFEAEQLDGDKYFPAGIKRDKYGSPVRYCLCPWKNNSIDIRNGKTVAPENILFLTNPDRPSQIRGVPACQSAFPMLHRINDVCDSEAIAWQMLSRLAIAVIRKQGPEIAYSEAREDPDKTSDELDGDLATRLSELDYALIYHGEPGDEVKGIERNIPGANFGESIRMFLRLLGLPLGLPLELVLLDWTRSNYSQSRAVLEQAYENFQQYQQDLEDGFYRPLFEWKLAQWQSSSLIAKSKEIESEWIKPTFPWIDQVKETQAQSAKVERGFITHGQVCKSLNLDRDEVIQRRAIEVTEAIEKSKAIEAKTGQKVPWQIFAGMDSKSSAPAPAPAANNQDQDEDRDEDQDEDQAGDQTNE